MAEPAKMGAPSFFRKNGMRGHEPKGIHIRGTRSDGAPSHMIRVLNR